MGETISLTPAIAFTFTFTPSGSLLPSVVRALQSMPSTLMRPVPASSSMGSTTCPMAPMTLSALVGVFFTRSTFFTNLRVKASVTPEITTNTMICTGMEPPRIAAMAAATAPRQNQMLTICTVAASMMSMTSATASQMSGWA